MNNVDMTISTPDNHDAEDLLIRELELIRKSLSKHTSGAGQDKFIAIVNELSSLNRCKCL